MKIKDIVLSIVRVTNKIIKCRYGIFKHMKMISYKVFENNKPPWQNKIIAKNFDLLIKDMVNNYVTKK